jgi:WS/DGAT/MGAT family acyltransferase
MSAEDAWFLYFEKPDAPLHIGSVAIYEGAVDFGRLCESMAARMHTIPRYRQRAVIPPFYAGHPTWEDDPAFTVERHLHLLELPAPGTEEQLRELAADVFAPMLPRDRPLWDITVIRGLEGDRTAYVSRVHHCLVDGVSGIELLLAVLDMMPEPEPTPPPDEPWEPHRLPGPLESWTEAVFDHWNRSMRAFTDWQESMLDTQGNLRRMADFARALEAALPALFRQPVRAPWNKPIGARRAAAWTAMSFQEVRGIRSALGGTVNDVMLSILGGALGRYLQAHGESVEGATLRLQIPVNVRTENQKGALGNRVSMMLPDIPVGISDPVARLGAVREEMERLKARDEANAFDAMLRIADNIPAAYHALAGIGGVPQGALNLVCTNVPGPLIPLWTVGHRMLAHYPLVPLAGDLGIGVGITSYDKDLYLGLMCDPDIVPDVDTIRQYVDEEFQALRRAADIPVSDLPDFGVSRNGHGAQAGVPTRAAAAASP